MRLIHFHATSGTGTPLPDVLAGEMLWLTDQYRRGNIVSWSRIPDDIPQRAAGEHAWARRVSAKSMLCIPMSAGPVIRSIAFTCVRQYRTWPAPLIRRLRLVGENFSNAVVRQRTEAALQSSESRHRAILKALPDLTFIISPEGIFLDYSGDSSQLLVAPEQFLGRRLEDVFPAALAARFRAAHARVSFTGEVVEVEYELPIGGEFRSYESRMVRREDGAIVSVVRDVTERLRAVRQLRESEERFRGVFTHSAIGISLTSPEGRWLQVNDALCAILGYTEAELLCDHVPGSDDSRGISKPTSTTSRRALAGEIDHFEMLKRYIRKDGRTISVLLTVSLHS